MSVTGAGQLDQLLREIRARRGRGHSLVIAAKCHPGGGVAALYADGVLTLVCQDPKCGKTFAWIKVASL